jgi:multidrug efflux system membrane fusion protein
MDLEGELAWERRVELGTTVSGLITEVRVLPGQRVEQGEVLVELDQRLYRARAERARAALDEAKQQREEAERELERAQELYDRTVLSVHELTLAQIAAAEADAALRSAQAALTEAQLEQEYSRITAPFAGLVVAVGVSPGEAVTNRLQVQPLVILAADQRMKAVAQVDTKQAATLTPGRAIRVAVAGAWFDGQVLGVGLEPTERDADGPRYALEVGFVPAVEEPLRAGQPATVRIDD